MKSSLESKVRCKISSDSPVIAWLVEWAAGVITRYAVKPNGRTAIEEVKGKRSMRPVAEFGEKVTYMPLKSAANPQTKFDNRVEVGVWLGLVLTSDETLIGTSHGVVRARSIRRLPEAERWDYTTLALIKGTPWKPVPSREGHAIPTHIHEDQNVGEESDDDEDGQRETQIDPEEEAATKDIIHQEETEDKRKGFYITKHMIESHGATEKCKGCRAILLGRRGWAHLPACKKQIH